MISENEFESLKIQRDLLFSGLKKVATDSRTPDSIKIFLNSLAKKVMEAKSKIPVLESNKPFHVGDIVTTTNNKVCRYKIERIYEEQGSTLVTVKTVWVKDNIAPTEGIHHNINIEILRHYG